MQQKHCFVRVMEEKNKIDKAIEQAIRQVGQERDAEDLATLKGFMAKQEKQNEYRECYYAPEIDKKRVLKPRKPISKEERQKIKEEHQKELEEQLKILLEHKQALIKKKHQRNRILYAFSSIAAIIAIVFSLNIYQDNRRMDKLFETYYTPLEYDSQLMSRSDDTISPELAFAMESYQNTDYATALQKFDSMHQVDENYLIYKAICLLETDKIENAITLLKELVGNGEGTEYYQQACWYLALVYLRNHEDEKAFAMIKHINDDNKYDELIQILN